ncbi:glycosyltransferase family 4 protein [Candidatus Nomurabacteria bacterium]|uniref:Glycosyltransferase family 4 protein n=1 Tax=candidate division WWE3 bacterium TaxID=2053526 RepID=A0A955E1C7_UNCKA|nr:glycosyltransferase family 4 protein [candidate division WWE3 bacterium]MCB9823611.1 glycosyltransferase family 4 protein [Candidatus Nomurabacteria bacterium]MCB9827406.1 glycosyltransferase family 4 protein [Candidatus Nomurabacteria bacterium]HXK52647.1 glycosyltransferase family 1 protein [bacterium]
MKIAIDAYQMATEGRVGTTTYIYNTVKNILENNQKNQTLLYAPGDILDEYTLPSAKSKILPTFISWTQVSLLLELLRNNPDVILLPRQTLPVLYRPVRKLLRVATLGRYRGTKLVSVIHDISGGWMRYGPTFATCVLSDQIVAVSQSTKKDMVSAFKIPEDKVQVIYEGLDESIFKAGPKDVSMIKEKYSENCDYVLYVGSLIKRKNLDRLIEAFAQVKESELVAEKYPKLKLVLAGGYDPKNKYAEQLLEKVSVAKDVIYVGKVPQEELGALYSGALVTALVSLKEGFGLTILESQACGTPVLTSNISSMYEISDNSCMHCNPYDTHSINNTMQEIILNDPLKTELITRGLKNIKKYNWGSSASSLVRLMSKIP